MGDISVPLIRSTVLRLRGLPFQSTEADIEHFFKDYTVKKCILCRRNGRATGEAFVQLDSETQAAEAHSQLNCKYIGHRYIEIFEATESDIHANASFETKGVVGHVLRLRGLPYSATSADVEVFFEGLGIVKSEEGIVFSVTSLGKPTGEAYVEFVSEDNQQEALKLHKHHMGSRYIELFKSTKADLMQALQQNRFYKEQAEKRQVLTQQTVMVPTLGNECRMMRYDRHVDGMSDVLKGLNVNERSSVMPPPNLYTSPSYDAMGSFRSFVQHQGFVDPRYYLPDPTRCMGSVYPGGKVYEAPSMLSQARTCPEMMRQPYMMRPLVQQPHQFMLRYPPRPTWLEPESVTRIHRPTTTFPQQYSSFLQNGLAGSPSGPSGPYTAMTLDQNHPLEILNGEGSFDYAVKSSPSKLS